MKLLDSAKELVVKIVRITPPGRLLAGFYFLAKNHLTKSGWKKSVTRRLPMNRKGEELPWFTYSCIYFLGPRLNKNLSVFEYGSGNSTIWFSKKTKNIISVEHHKQWFTQMKEKFKKFPNIEYLSRDLDSGNYQKEILNYDQQFDIIVLDGRDRVRCSLNVLQALKEGGVIIWDNADREKYAAGHDFLRSNGFKSIDFYGMGPISAHAWCTAIFYKGNNFLNI